MDVALYEGKTLNITAEISRYNDSEKNRMIDKYRKAAEKKQWSARFVMKSCDYVLEKLMKYILPI